MTHWHVVHLADPRRDDRHLSALVADIRTQLSAGYRVGVVPIFGDVALARPWNPMLRELVERDVLAVAGAEEVLRADLAMIRRPSDIDALPEGLAITARNRVVLWSETRAEGIPDGPAPDSRDLVLFARTGKRWTWSPTSDAAGSFLDALSTEIVRGETLDGVPGRHLAWLRSVVGPPASERAEPAPRPEPVRGAVVEAAGEAPQTCPDPARGAPSIGSVPDTRARVLFVTDNGHGLGHLSRVVALATRRDADVDTLVLSHSEAFPVAATAGLPVEYMPSAKRLGLDRAGWGALVRARADALTQRWQPNLVVLDFVNPPVAYVQAAHAVGAHAMWLRRGLWRVGAQPDGDDPLLSFDSVLEPLDLAAPFDLGRTPRHLGQQQYGIDPVSSTESAHAPSRAVARAELGLPAHGRVLLVSLSADDPTELVRMVERARDAVRAVDPDITVFVPLHPLHREHLGRLDGAVTRPVFPTARLLNAFDAAVSTAGYNAFHELVEARVPTVFLARTTASLDDQARRAASADIGGFGRSVDDLWSPALEDAVAEVLHPVSAGRMGQAAGIAHPGNGARAGARLISATARDRAGVAHSDPASGGSTPPKASAPPTPGLGEVRSGRLLPPRRRGSAPPVLFVVWGPTVGQLEDAVRQISRRQLVDPTFWPLVVTDAPDPTALRQAEIVYETAVDASRWAATGVTSTLEDYRRQRVRETVAIYRPAEVVTVRSAGADADGAGVIDDGVNDPQREP